MTHEVVVVGGGIGGLTVAALLAARGVDVCLLERQPQVGGCVASVEKFGFVFEPTVGLYSGWGPDDLHQRIFSELPVGPPETRPVDPAYFVRLADGAEVAIEADSEKFEYQLRKTFPECADEAVSFFRKAATTGDFLLQSFRDGPPTKLKDRLSSFLPGFRSTRLKSIKNTTLRKELAETSDRFQSFIQFQLRAFNGTSLDECSYPAACLALSLSRENLFAIRGGAAALAERLAESIKRSGGMVRLDSPVLRLSYDNLGKATGVDLLSGENIEATRAIVSNMTVWDTYGKLIGLQRTPPEIKKRLASLQSSGVYLVFAALNEVAARRLPGDRLLVSTKKSSDSDSLIDTCGFAFASAPEWDGRGVDNKRAATLAFRAEVDQWFTFQADQTEQEEKDQMALEVAWQILHEGMPELGGDIEVIETATPQTYYDATRRKLGMVGSPNGTESAFDPASTAHRTTLPNVFMVGDTVSSFSSVASVSHSALTVATEIAH